MDYNLMLFCCQFGYSFLTLLPEKVKICQYQYHTFQIDCQPEVYNVFDEVNIPTCSQNRSTAVYSILSRTPAGDNFCPECLLPCETIDYTFQVLLSSAGLGLLFSQHPVQFWV